MIAVMMEVLGVLEMILLRPPPLQSSPRMRGTSKERNTLLRALKNIVVASPPSIRAGTSI